jgi:HEAT repeat protein
MERSRFTTSFTSCALALGSLCCGRSENPPAPPVAAPAHAAAADFAHDDRLAHLMGGCAKSEPFLADTSDPLPILVANLSFGQPDQMRAAREELAVYGERAIPELRRLFDASFGAAYLGQRVQNVVEVLGLMRSDAGREMLLRALVHPEETVRKAAARALQNHTRPEDYDVLLEGLAASGHDSQGDFALALVAADRPRAERQLGPWIEAGESKSLVDLLATHLCTTHDRDVTESWRKLLPATDGKLRVYLQAAIANQPDAAALAELREWLMDTTKPARRQLVAAALAKVGLSRELAPLVTKTDPDDSLRKAAIDAVAQAEYGKETRAVLEAALADPLPEVRDIALTTLCAHQEPSALDAAFEFLKGARPEFESALKALRIPLARDPALARRAFDTLTQLHRGEVGTGLVDERMLIRAIGQVPLVDAARYVMQVGEHAEGVIQGLPAHRWYAQAAGNSGSDGLAYLRERWKTEEDPSRRMDLVMAGSFEKSDAVLLFLVDVLDSPRSTPFEALYAADRLARLGPMEFSSPILKRAALKMNDREARPAMNCLLWTWYGPKP